MNSVNLYSWHVMKGAVKMVTFRQSLELEMMCWTTVYVFKEEGISGSCSSTIEHGLPTRYFIPNETQTIQQKAKLKE